jgi:hypothetical protein
MRGIAANHHLGGAWNHQMGHDQPLAMVGRLYISEASEVMISPPNAFKMRHWHIRNMPRKIGRPDWHWGTTVALLHGNWIPLKSFPKISGTGSLQSEFSQQLDVVQPNLSSVAVKLLGLQSLVNKCQQSGIKSWPQKGLAYSEVKQWHDRDVPYIVKAWPKMLIPSAQNSDM